jgi:hypothetical protein
MMNFLQLLKFRNEPLCFFGAACFAAAILMLCVSRSHPIMVTGANAWYKPVKFALSIGTLCWTMAWYTYEIGLPLQVKYYSWAMITLLGYDLLYISIQAARGQTSHHNTGTLLYAALTAGLAIAAVAATLYTAYIGLLFWVKPLQELPKYYLWSIRLGIALFAIFALEGGLMGANGSHTIGGPDGETGLPFLGWSRKYGDPRIAHFIGMHALQLLPLLAWYVLKDKRLVFATAVIYAGLAIFVLIQAIGGKALIN